MGNEMSLNSKRAIFFDFGDTLASTTPPYLTRIATAMKAAGYPVLDREFEIAYIKTDYEIYTRYKAQGKITPKEYGEWFFPILCKYLSLEEDPYAIRAQTRQALKEIKFGRALLPGADELLNYLKGKGFILAVISNNDGKTEEKCEEVGIREYFDIIVDSTKLGLVKPDSRIFKFVLEKLNLSQHEVIHIGDLYGSDVMGGLNASLDVIWFNERQVERLDGSQVIEVQSLDEIKNLLTAAT
jgi:HAD superfamily hydrolase (TIGR01549 family)